MLTMSAEGGGSSAQIRSGKRVSTAEAGEARSPVGLMGLLGRACSPLGIAVVPKGGSAAADGGGKNRSDRFGEPEDLVAIERAGLAMRRDARREKALVGVDVAESGHDRLIKQGDLDRPGGPREARAKAFGKVVGRVRQAIGTKPPHSIGPKRFVIGIDDKVAKPPRIDVPQEERSQRRLERPADVLVGKRRRSADRRLDPHASGHAQAHPKRSTRTRLDDRELLAMPLEPFDRRAKERRPASRLLVGPRREARRLDERASPHRDRLDPRRDEDRFERAAKAFDFRKFRHRAEDASGG